MDRIELWSSESLCVIVRHPNHQNNVIPPEEAERVVDQGRRLLKMGLKPKQIANVIASIRERSQETANLLLRGLGTEMPVITSHAYDALDEIGTAAKEFKTASKVAGSPPWEMLAEAKGAGLCQEFGIADRLVRATQFWTVCTAVVQLAGAGRVVVVSGHNGNGIEPAIELAKAQALGERISSAGQLPDPPRYVNEAGVVLLFVNTTTGLLSREPVYLDAE
jgi:broad specificity phosphatase PhoE